MEIRKESDLQNLCCDSQSNKRLSNYRANLARDRKDVVFDPRVEEVCLRYCLHPEQFSEVKAYLNNLSDSEGPFCRSFKSYDKMEQTLEGFQSPEAPNGVWRKHFQVGKRRVADRYRKAGLKTLSFRNDNEIYELVRSLHTSTGFENILTGVKHKCDLERDGLLSLWREKVSAAIDKGSFESYMIWFHRSQASGEFTDDGDYTYQFKRKTRPVWAVDVWTVLSEMTFSKPLNNWLTCYSYSAIGKSDAAIWNWTLNKRRWSNGWISLDYSKYDSTIPSWLIHEAFDVLKCAFRMSEFDESLLKVIENDFIHKNVITVDSVIHVDHGNPSGSGLTAIINGICNELMTEQWLSKFNTSAEYMIMGDDNLIYFTGVRPDVAAIASYITYNFGVKVNTDKTKFGLSREAPEFLSRIWLEGGPYRHPFILISKMLFPERFRDYDRNPDLSPELIFYSYILGYKAGMEKMFDTARFIRDTNLRAPNIAEGSAAFKSLPYNVQVSW